MTRSAASLPWVVRLRARSPLAAEVVIYLLLAPSLLAVGPAIFGREVSLILIVVTTVSCLFSGYLQDSHYWRLDVAVRRRAAVVFWTARPSGDRIVDETALDRLALAARTSDRQP